MYVACPTIITIQFKWWWIQKDTSICYFLRKISCVFVSSERSTLIGPRIFFCIDFSILARMILRLIYIYSSSILYQSPNTPLWVYYILSHIITKGSFCSHVLFRSTSLFINNLCKKSKVQDRGSNSNSKFWAEQRNTTFFNPDTKMATNFSCRHACNTFSLLLWNWKTIMSSNNIAIFYYDR